MMALIIINVLIILIVKYYVNLFTEMISLSQLFKERELVFVGNAEHKKIHVSWILFGLIQHLDKRQYTE